jgi:hypothetical protein
VAIFRCGASDGIRAKTCCTQFSTDLRKSDAKTAGNAQFLDARMQQARAAVLKSGRNLEELLSSKLQAQAKTKSKDKSSFRLSAVLDLGQGKNEAGRSRASAC